MAKFVLRSSEVDSNIVIRLIIALDLLALSKPVNEEANSQQV